MIDSQSKVNFKSNISSLVAKLRATSPGLVAEESYADGSYLALIKDSMSYTLIDFLFKLCRIQTFLVKNVGFIFKLNT